MAKITKSTTKAITGHLLQGLLKVQSRSSQPERVSGDDQVLLDWIDPHGAGSFPRCRVFPERKSYRHPSRFSPRRLGRDGARRGNFDGVITKIATMGSGLSNAAP